MEQNNTCLITRSIHCTYFAVWCSVLENESMTNGQMDEMQCFCMQLQDTQNGTYQSHKHSPHLGNMHSTYYLQILAIILITG